MRGTWYVAPTAFNPDGSLDLESQRRLVEMCVAWDVDGVMVLGVMGEASFLSDDERDAVLRATLDAAQGRVPVVVGCSGSGVHRVRGYIQRARELGVVGAMVSAPPLLKNLDALPSFYRAVSGELPILVQDEPAATGVFVPVSALLECLRAARSRSVKLEDPPTVPKIARLLAADPELEVFGGLGGVSALGELRRGACGTMTGFALPEVLASVRRATEAGDALGAARVFDRYLPLIHFESQPVEGLSIRKEVLRRRGALAHNTTRSLSPGLDEATLAELDDVLARVGVVLGPERFEARA